MSSEFPSPSSPASLSWLYGGMQQHLQRALDEMSNRQQVQDCLSDMVTNVEWAAQCNQQVEMQQTKRALQMALTQQATVLQETALIQQTNETERNELANALVREMFQMSQSLGELYQLRQDHQELSNNYDALVAKLLQAEERIQFMQEGGGGDTNNANSAEPSGATAGQTTVAPATETEATSMTPLSSPKSSEAPPEAATEHSGEPSPAVPSSASGTSEGGEDDNATSTATTNEEAANHLVDTKEGQTVTADGVIKSDTTPTEEKAEVPPDASLDDSAPRVSEAETKPTPGDLLVEEDGPSVTTAAAPAAAVVSIVEEDPPPSLETLETATLMHIFQYLDALDILNTAQVNISMYSRVDNLFGLGDAPQSEGDNSTIATADSNHAVNTSSLTAPPQSTPGASQSGASTAGTSVPSTGAPSQTGPGMSSTLSTTTTSDSTLTGTRSTSTGPQPPSLPSTPKHGVGSSNAAVGSTSTSAAAATPPPGGERSLFGFLQPRKSPMSATTSAPTSTSSTTGGASGAPTTGPTLTRKSSRSSSQQPPEPAPMNAALANSMASKLTDAELNAIIQMTERLRNKESQLEQLRTERERLLAQLDGTDAVKQFLVAKVWNMEQSLKQTEEQQAKVAQQIASDQEVIAFLDGRVQELEESLSTRQTETDTVLAEWKAYQTQAEQKATVLTDMLRFERERVQETQSEFKATKKLLVKEVKSCRAQIMALSAENQAVAQENETLKRALLTSNGSSGATSSPARYQQHVRISSMS